MICQNCKKELKDGINFCPNCGMKIGQQNGSGANVGQGNSGFNQSQINAAYANSAVNVNKPVWKKAWFWVVVVAVGIVCIGKITGDSESDDSSDAEQTASNDDYDKENYNDNDDYDNDNYNHESEDRTDLSDREKTNSSDNGNGRSNSQAISVSFDQLNENHDSYVGKRILLRGAYMELFGFLYFTPGLISEYEYEIIKLNYPSRIAYDLNGNVLGEVDGSQEGWVVGIFKGTNAYGEKEIDVETAFVGD